MAQGQKVCGEMRLGGCRRRSQTPAPQAHHGLGTCRRGQFPFRLLYVPISSNIHLHHSGNPHLGLQAGSGDWTSALLG
jgi:hypothetical protein